MTPHTDAKPIISTNRDLFPDMWIVQSWQPGADRDFFVQHYTAPTREEAEGLAASFGLRKVGFRIVRIPAETTE